MKNLFNLQMFAEAEDTNDSQQTDQNTNQNEADSSQAKYSDADLDKIINAKFAKWAAEKEKAVEEAKAEGEKLAKMNADQKKDYELKKAAEHSQALEAPIADLIAKQQRADLSASAASILQNDYSIAPTEDVLAFVVDDASILYHGQPTASGNRLAWIKADAIPGVDQVVKQGADRSIYRFYHPKTEITFLQNPTMRQKLCH